MAAAHLVGEACQYIRVEHENDDRITSKAICVALHAHNSHGISTRRRKTGQRFELRPIKYRMQACAGRAPAVTG